MDRIREINIRDNKYSIRTGITIIATIFGLLVNMIIFNWLRNMNKCKCSKIKSYNEFLSYISATFIIWQIILLFCFIIYDANPDNYPPLIKIMAIVMTVLIIIYYIFLYKYIISLKKIKCDCGNLVVQNFIYYYVLIAFSILLFVIILLLLALFFSSSVS